MGLLQRHGHDHATRDLNKNDLVERIIERSEGGQLRWSENAYYSYKQARYKGFKIKYWTGLDELIIMGRTIKPGRDQAYRLMQAIHKSEAQHTRLPLLLRFLAR